MSNYLQKKPAHPFAIDRFYHRLRLRGAERSASNGRPQADARVLPASLPSFRGRMLSGVESLVTEKLESAIGEIEEVKKIESVSSTNVSFLVIEIADEVDENEADNIWSQIRDKADEARRDMPPETQEPQFKEYDITASTVILGLKWELDSEPNYAILNRLAKQLEDRLDAIPGTEKTELFGDPEEEILVTLDPESMDVDEPQRHRGVARHRRQRLKSFSRSVAKPV